MKLSYVMALLQKQSVFSLTSRMSLILVLLYTNDYWYLKIPIVLLISASIIFEGISNNNNFWLGILVVLTSANLNNWYSIDNHQYLITYWCFALYLSSLSDDPDKTLARNSRLLIGLTFLFATFWKLISSDFLDGSFFYFTLLTDQRFADITTYVGSLNRDRLIQNYQAMRQVLAYDSQIYGVQLQNNSQVLVIAKIITYWSILIEGLVAAGFLLPLTSVLGKWRNFLLILFVITTYAIAPVVGFGSVLIIMGFAQSASESKKTRLAYILTFFLLQIYTLPRIAIIDFFLLK